MEHALDNSAGRLEPGYEYIKEIASGGYGYVYLFIRKGKDAEDYVAGKFVYRRSFGPNDDAASGAAYRRAFEGLQNFCSVSGGGNICCGSSMCANGMRKVTSAT